MPSTAPVYELDPQSELVRELWQILNDRKAKNRKYSLRAFARDLKTSPATLSEFLHGKRELSSRMMLRIAAAAGLSTAKRKALSRMLEKDDHTFLQPSNEDLQMIINDPNHFAILSLAETAGFDSDVKCIASRMRLSIKTADQYVQRLLRAGLLIQNEQKVLSPSRRQFRVGDDGPRPSMRENMENYIKSWKLAVDTMSDQTRYEFADFSQIVISADPSKLPEIKRRVKRFRRSLAKYFGKGKKQEVYSISLQIFPLSH